MIVDVNVASGGPGRNDVLVGWGSGVGCAVVKKTMEVVKVPPGEAANDFVTVLVTIGRGGHHPDTVSVGWGSSIVEVGSADVHDTETKVLWSSTGGKPVPVHVSVTSGGVVVASTTMMTVPATLLEVVGVVMVAVEVFQNLVPPVPVSAGGGGTLGVGSSTVKVETGLGGKTTEVVVMVSVAMTGEGFSITTTVLVMMAVGQTPGVRGVGVGVSEIPGTPKLDGVVDGVDPVPVPRGGATSSLCAVWKGSWSQVRRGARR